ncbi:MAG TPA: S46 family peptidase [Chitinophagales bacterium]|nr:S46 family peptidase [Chitinophagales bacterium]
MRKLFLSLTSIFYLLTSATAYADEGMWLPMLLNETVYHDMQNEGLKLSSEDIYSVNHSSMKDGVLLFGGGCTGEMISSEGLLITNFHCGRGALQSHSTIEKDYLKTGFWAMNKTEELQSAGLAVTFIVRMDDVTTLVLNGVTGDMSEMHRQAVIEGNAKAITDKIMNGTSFNAVVRSFYYGNQYILIVSQTFRDVRLVGAPPESVGDFGGDADNWVWPRHNADFSLFRIYADSSNNAADYAAENIPYRPNYFFSISLKGVKENDFAMVYGFPGKTTEYLPSYAVDLTQNISDPDRVTIRDARLKIWWDEMKKNDTMKLHYISKYYGLSNGWKKWQGEILGLNRVNALGKKQAYEVVFTHAIENNVALKSAYGDLLSKMKIGYDSLRNRQFLLDYYGEALKAPEIFIIAINLRSLLEAAKSDTTKPETLHQLSQKIKKQCEGFFKNYDEGADRKVTAAMFNLFVNNVGANQLPTSIKATFAQQHLNGESFTKLMFDKSFLDDQKKLFEFLDHFKKGTEKKLLKDEIYVFGNDVDGTYNHFILPNYQKWNDYVSTLQRTYMKAQMEVFTEKKFYPDANLSLRVAYGKVIGYEPKDGVSYDFFTTSDGIQQKYKPGDEYYDTPKKLLDLFQQKDFGNYAASDGTLHTCFITSSHTTGGNSGSPVVDANGNLIGTNFDRCWEGTMSDLYYDPSLCRNIVLDVRYTLFIIDKFGGAGYLLNEMKLVN